MGTCPQHAGLSKEQGTCAPLHADGPDPLLVATNRRVAKVRELDRYVQWAVKDYAAAREHREMFDGDVRRSLESDARAMLRDAQRVIESLLTDVYPS